MERIGAKDLKKVVTKEVPSLESVKISAEIEERYTEIGRAVVANAVRLAQEQLSRLDKPTRDDFNKLVVAVPVWVTGRPDMQDPSRIGHVCCVCCREDSGVIICRGDCC